MVWMGRIINNEAMSMNFHQTLDRVDVHKNINNEASLVFLWLRGQNDSWYSVDWIDIIFSSLYYYWWPWPSIHLNIAGAMVLAVIPTCRSIRSLSQGDRSYTICLPIRFHSTTCSRINRSPSFWVGSKYLTTGNALHAHLQDESPSYHVSAWLNLVPR